MDKEQFPTPESGEIQEDGYAYAYLSVGKDTNFEGLVNDALTYLGELDDRSFGSSEDFRDFVENLETQLAHGILDHIQLLPSELPEAGGPNGIATQQFKKLQQEVKNSRALQRNSEEVALDWTARALESFAGISEETIVKTFAGKSDVILDAAKGMYKLGEGRPFRVEVELMSPSLWIEELETARLSDLWSQPIEQIEPAEPDSFFDVDGTDAEVISLDAFREAKQKK